MTINHTYDFGFDGVGVAGQVHGPADSEQVSAFIASEQIKPGRLLEIVPGTEANETPSVRHAQSALGPLARVAGVSVLRPGKGLPSSGNPTEYATGDRVLVIRRGIINVEFVGTAPGAFEALRVSHSSTIATDRGKFTISAASATAGSEVSQDLAICRRAGTFSDGDATCVKVSLNLG